MITKRIFRVDDRLIHGQVIEGWIKYYKLSDVVIVNDRVYNDPLQKMIYSSILPSGTSLEFYSIELFREHFTKKISKKLFYIVIFESVDDIYALRELIDDEIYVNIGCVASRTHKIEVSDTVFLDKEEIVKLSEIRGKYNIHVKKLPWETEVEIKNFLTLIEGEI